MTETSTSTVEVVVSDELDVAYEDGECIGDALAGLIQDTDLHPELVARHGPGGGWPVYRFHGVREDIAYLYGRYYGEGADLDAAIERIDQLQPSLL